MRKTPLTAAVLAAGVLLAAAVLVLAAALPRLTRA